MNSVSRRDILAALAAIAVTCPFPALSQPSVAEDLSVGRPIGEAWLAANPGTNIAMLRNALLPYGLGSEAIARLRARVASDFRRGRLFVHDGWQLSRTEAQLFALLSRG
jgi:hypothetical protein